VQHVISNALASVLVTIMAVTLFPATCQAVEGGTRLTIGVIGPAEALDALYGGDPAHAHTGLSALMRHCPRLASELRLTYSGSDTGKIMNELYRHLIVIDLTATCAAPATTSGASLYRDNDGTWYSL
jgi:hypothetical protein